MPCLRDFLWLWGVQTCIKELAVSAAVDKVMANMRSILMEEITGLKANTTQDIKGLKATVYADVSRLCLRYRHFS